MQPERLLVIYVRLVASVMLLALPFIFVPHSWMSTIHAQLGLGDLPDLPIIRYLTRSVSALYGLYGALLLYLSFDLRRYLPALLVLGWFGIAFGVLMVGVDLAAGLPAHWTWREGPVILLESGILLGLALRLKHSRSTWGQPDPR